MKQLLLFVYPMVFLPRELNLFPVLYRMLKSAKRKEGTISRGGADLFIYDTLARLITKAKKYLELEFDR